MTALAERQFERILIIKPSSPGDILHALPVLRGLRRRYPNARIDWLIATSFADLIAADPAVSNVVLFDRKRFGRIGRELGVTGEFVSFLRGLRSTRYDLVVDLQGLFRSGFMARATGARVRLGFAAARELAWIFYTHRIAARGPDAHAVDRNYAVADMLGFDNAPLDLAPALTAEDEAFADRLTADAGIERPADLAVLVPATRWETKCWPAERFGELAAALRERHGLCALLVGGAADRALGDAAVAASDGAAVNACGQTSLRQLAAVIARARIVVTADSTPMHLAAALDRPLVALFGPTSPSRTGPYGRMDDVVRVDLDCSPCYLRRLAQCPHDHACMDRLSVARVAQAVDQRLGADAQATR